MGPAGEGPKQPKARGGGGAGGTARSGSTGAPPAPPADVAAARIEWAQRGRGPSSRSRGTGRSLRMEAQLQYGTGTRDAEIPSSNVTVLAPRPEEGLPDEAAAFREAARSPIGSAPLRELVGSDEKLAVVIPDITRALPRERLLPWLFEELAHVPPENVTIVNGTGSHRANTEEELVKMVGRDVYENYRVVNHDAHDPETLLFAGRTPEGRDVYMNREYVEADRRVALGFIEPHFMAGFSGGYKGIFPAVADVGSIMHYHRAAVIGHEGSTRGGAGAVARASPRPWRTSTRSCTTTGPPLSGTSAAPGV